MRRVLFAAASALLTITLCGQSRAEIRAITDRTGHYRETRILTGDTRRGVGVWSPVGSVVHSGTLNPAGDAQGDLWPMIAEPVNHPHYAWVVWSRLNGSEYDLVWARWTAQGWQEVLWLQPTADLQGDDLDADVTFDVVSRPYVVWWRNERGTGRVYLSVFLQSEWMAPYAVSEPGTDSRFPEIEILSSGVIQVNYDTPDGRVQQNVFFDLPVTITDDIDPLDCVTVDTPRHIEQRLP